MKIVNKISKRIAAWWFGGAMAACLAVNPAGAQTADVGVTVKAVPNAVAAGSNTTFTIAVTNQGPDSASNVLVTNTLPAGFAFVSAGISGAGNMELIATNQIWKYDESVRDLGANWMGIGYDDTSWTNGRATFGTNNNVSLPWPFNTILDKNNGANFVVTAYFRTTFNYQGPGTATLSMVDLVDDASAFYLNGQEIRRDSFLPSGTLTYQTLATSTVSNAGLRTNSIVVSNLVSGVNVFAAEVHQSTTNSSDLVFGLRVNTVAATQTWATNASGQVVFNLGAMGAGEYATLTVTAKSSDLGQYTDSVDASTDTTDANPDNNAAQAVISVLANEADLGLTITDTPDPVYALSNLVYTLKVTNGGPVAVSGIIITNYLPSNFSVLGSGITLGSGSVSNSGFSQVVFYLDTILNGGAATMTITGRPGAGTVGSILTNRAVVTAGVTDNNPNNNAAITTTSVLRAPLPVDLGLTVADSPASVGEGLLMTNSITVRNYGPNAAAGIRVTNILAAGFTLVTNGSAAFCVPTNGMVICAWPNTIANGGRAAFTMILRANEPGVATNVFFVGTTDRDTNSANDSVTLVTTVLTMRADLSVTSQISPGTLVEGDYFTNVVTVLNAGPTNADNIILTNRQAGGTILAVRVNGDVVAFTDLGAGVLACNLGSLSANASLRVTLEGRAMVAGTVGATVSVAGAQKDINLANNTVTAAAVPVTRAQAVDLAVGLTATPAALYAGDTLTYFIRVSNNGTLPGSGVVLTNVLPPSVTLISVTNSQGACSNVAGMVICSLGSIPASGAATVTVQVAVPPAGLLTNVAWVTELQPDFNAVDNMAVLTSEVFPNTTSDLVLTVVPVATNLYAGEEITYRVTLANAGPLAATGVLFTNWLPESATFVRASVTTGTFYSPTNGVLVFSVGNLARGASMQASIVARADEAGMLTNVTEAGANQLDPTSSRTEAVVKVVPSADVTLDLSTSAGLVTPKTTVVYSLVARNNGPSSASGVMAFVYLPVTATFLGAYASTGDYSTMGAMVLWEIGSLAAGEESRLEMDLIPGNVPVFVVTAGVLANEHDPVVNNTVSASNIVGGALDGKGIVVTPTMDVNALTAALVAGGVNGIKVTSVRLKANNSGTSMSSGLYTIFGTNLYGLLLPGVVLSSGDVADYGSITGTNTVYFGSTSYGVPADDEEQRLLVPITGGGTNAFQHYDATQFDIYFDMLPGFNEVSFDVVFGSMEYPIYVGDLFIDGFGIYLDGVNIAYAAGEPVNINHPDMAFVPETILNGVIDINRKPVMVFKAPVVPGTTGHRLTFIIADTYDSILDSTVYIGALQGVQGAVAELGVTANSTPEPVRVGAPLTYTVVVTNAGPNVATNTVVTAVFPDLFENWNGTATSGEFTVTDGVLHWQVGNLARHGSATLTLSGIPLFDARFAVNFEAASDLKEVSLSNNVATVISTVVELGSFYNPLAVTIRDGAAASPYPSVIQVSGLTGVVDKVVVTLLGLQHSFPADISALLVGPDGRGTILMAQAGAGNAVENISLRFDDAAANVLPFDGTMLTGSYRPGNYALVTYFPGLANLAHSAFGSTLSNMRRVDPNGDWKLYLYDNAGGDAGTLAGGWNLHLTTAPDLAVVVSGGDLTISWPDMDGYVLEANANLSTTTGWEAVVQSPVVGGGRRSVTLPLSAGYRFFRLRK
jgi:uncharacterized repeat protein (TIGR01451 family)